MAVVSQISVGDVMYYQVDDIPTHTAPKGSVAMMTDPSPTTTGLIYEDWEGGDLTNWTVVNDTTNQWHVGTAQVYEGTYGVYGSNDSGVTANYTNSTQVSHFYKDITIPSNAENVTLTFRWRSFMENSTGGPSLYDYGSVSIIDTTTTPVAGTEVATALATSGGNGRLNETGANDGKFNEGYKYTGGIYDGTWFSETISLSGYVGETKRLVFSVVTDGLSPNDAPAMSIDNIYLSYTTDNRKYSNGFTYINNDGGSTWLKLISSSYGEISLTDATNTIDFDTQSTASFYAFNGTPTGGSWQRNPQSTDDWILATENTTTDDLKYTGSTTMRAYCHSSTTVRGGTTKGVSHNITTAQNFTVVTTSVNQYFTMNNSSTASCGHTTIREIVPNDYVLIAINPVTRDAGGGQAATRSYIPKHGKISVTKIDEPLVDITTVTLLDEDWESNSFTANTWNVVNDTTNQWVIGTAQVDTGTYGLYGSNDGGTTANYSNAGDVSHIYKDFTFPADASNITLTFVWRSFMENAGGATQYDYGTVNIISTATTVTAGAEVATALATAGGVGRVNQTGANAGKFNEGYRYGGTYDGTWFTETIDLSSYAGTSVRLVFTLKDDGAAPADAPAMSIDNILLTYGGGNVY